MYVDGHWRLGGRSDGVGRECGEQIGTFERGRRHANMTSEVIREFCRKLRVTEGADGSTLVDTAGEWCGVAGVGRQQLVECDDELDDVGGGVCGFGSGGSELDDGVRRLCEVDGLR